jgi:hypothetical protein
LDSTLAVHDYLNLKANLVIGGASSLPAGVCKTSATAIHATCSAQISEKSIQRSLAHLEKIGWIKRWNVRGKHGNYPVLICRASVHDVSGNERRVSGEETTDWRNPVYTPVCESSVSRPRTVQLLSTDREERKQKREETKNTAAKITPSVDSRHKLAFDSCYEAYREKFGVIPTWAGREGKTLRRFLSEHTGISTDEIARRFVNLLASTDRYHAEKHGSLIHLLSNFDIFADGPIHKHIPEGATYAKPKRQGFDPIATAAALGLVEPTLSN